MGDMLKGKVAVITGAGSGLGRAHAFAMAAQGASVVVNDLGTSWDGFGTTSEAADLVVQEIQKSGGKAVASYDSVAEEKGADAIIQRAVDEYGRVDILVNNAGFLRHENIDEITFENWDGVLKTHVYGTMFCTRAASRHMKKQQYGRIVSTSSHIGFGFAGQSAYATAKEAITGFCRSAAREFAPHGITCNVIRPVAAWRGQPAANLKPGKMEKNSPAEISALVVYLVSEAANDINGCIFEVFRGHVGIFTDPPPVEQVVHKDGSWTPEELAGIIPNTLTRGRSREVFAQTFPGVFAFLNEME